MLGFQRFLSKFVSLTLLTLCVLRAAPAWADGTVSAPPMPPQSCASRMPAGFTAITSARDLEGIVNNLRGKYFLCQNLSLDQNFKAIGEANNRCNAFRGVFDGNGYVISRRRPTTSQCGGLFGQIGTRDGEGEVRNLVFREPNLRFDNGSNIGVLAPISYGLIDNVTIDAGSSSEVRGLSRVGGIVGVNNGVITNSRITGTLKLVGRSRVGGIAGESYYGSIINSTARANISVLGFANGISSAPAEGIGGLVGYSRYNTEIKNSKSYGNISYSTAIPTAVGGLVGFYGGGLITSSESHVNVSGGRGVGGFIGAVADSDDFVALRDGFPRAVPDYVKIHKSLAAGEVKGQTAVGGFVGLTLGVMDNAQSARPTSLNISQSYSTGTVTAQIPGSSASFTGGFIGLSDSTSIQDNFSLSTVTGDRAVGGFIGEARSVVLGNAYAFGKATSRLSGVCSGGFVGSSRNSSVFWAALYNVTRNPKSCPGGTRFTETAMQQIQTYQSLGWDIAPNGAPIKTWVLHPSSTPALTR